MILQRDILFNLCHNDYYAVPNSIALSVGRVIPSNSHRVAGMIAFALYRWVNDITAQ
jgi:hypothetical protein